MSASWTDEFRGTERFVIERRIGIGAVGVVYRAYDRERNERVAIKALRQLDASAMYRLKREFRTLSDLVHPNLVSLYELFSVSGQWFFTMELVAGSIDFLTYVRLGASARPTDTAFEGPPDGLTGLSPGLAGDAPTVESSDMHTRVDPPAAQVQEAGEARGGPIADRGLSPAQEARLRAALVQLGEGLAAIHQAGMLHRDVKPSNALVTHEGRVVLLDFGLVTEFGRQERSITPEQCIVGTVPYISPEQAAGGPLSPASDWYSVGVMLYEALSGRQPFRGQALQVLMDKQQFEPPPPHAWVAGVPEDLDRLCVELLRRDPAARPPAGEILRRLGAATTGGGLPPAFCPPARRPPFVGRNRELEALAAAFAAVQSGRTALVHLHGRSGVGKTTLVQQFLRDLAEPEETVVLSGRCYERESVPYKAFDSLVDALAHHLSHLPQAEAAAVMPRDVQALARVFPALRRVHCVAQAPARPSGTPDQQELRDRAFAALRELLGRMSDRKPLVLWIDDLQWGDLDSVALLNDLVAPPGQPALLLLVASRSEDRDTSPVLRALVESLAGRTQTLNVHEIELQPLTQEEARHLALTLIGTGDASAAAISDAIAHESGGNPYFVDALVRYQEARPGGDDRWTPGKSVSLDEAIWSRARRLPDAALSLLEVVAVAGHPLRQRDACRAVGLSGGEHEAMNALRAAHMIRTRGDRPEDEIEAYHDRVRETVLTKMATEKLRIHHAHLGPVLEASGGADPAVLAAHFVGAGQAERAGEYYARAAAQAADALAFDRAASLYRLALQFRPAAEGRALRRRLADALANAGRGAEAAREYLLAAGSADPTESLEWRRLAATQFLISGHIDEGLAELRTVLATVGMSLPRTPRRALWSLLWRRAQLRLRGLRFRKRDADRIAAEELTRFDICWSATVGLSMVDPVCGGVFQARGLLAALRSGEPHRITRSLALEAMHTSTAGGRAMHHAERLLQQAEALGRDLDSPHATAWVTAAAGVAACLQGRWKRAVELCDRAERVFRDHCTGVAWELDTAQCFPLVALYWLGQFAEITRRARVLISEARKRGNIYTLNNVMTFTMPAAAAVDPDSAERQLRECIDNWSHEGFHVQHFYALQGQVVIDLYRGHGLAAWRHVTEQWPALARSLLLRVQNIRISMHDARARCALAAAGESPDPKPLLRAAQRDARTLEREKMPWARALARLVRAGVAAARGDTASAVPLLEDATCGFDAADMALHAAVARKRLGELIGSDAGRAMVAEADARISAQETKSPARMTALFAPGFPG